MDHGSTRSEGKRPRLFPLSQSLAWKFRFECYSGAFTRFLLIPTGSHSRDSDAGFRRGHESSSFYRSIIPIFLCAYSLITLLSYAGTLPQRPSPAGQRPFLCVGRRPIHPGVAGISGAELQSFGRAIGSDKWVSRRHIWLWVGVTLNLVLLGVFKYLAFIAENIDLVLGQLHVGPLRVSPLHLPVGISFFTFMGISYLVDVHRKSIHLEADPIKFSLYLTLFPHLIAGPIVRYSAIAKELTSRRLSMEGIAYGTRRFVIGIGKKVLIANVAGAAADRVFLTPPGQLGAASAWLVAVCYTLQIYYDFSGYSDMAIGLAKMFGFTFPENFNYPYLSRSITEFWTRWHISLSSWLRDYLFFPLGCGAED